MPSHLNVFEMIITPDMEYPMLCTGVKRGYGDDSQQTLRLEMINLNSANSWFDSEELGEHSTDTVVPRHDQLAISHVSQLDKDTILVAVDNVVKLVNLEGRLKSNKKHPCEIVFDHKIESVGKCCVDVYRKLIDF